MAANQIIRDIDNPWNIPLMDRNTRGHRQSTPPDPHDTGNIPLAGRPSGLQDAGGGRIAPTHRRDIVQGV